MRENRRIEQSAAQLPEGQSFDPGQFLKKWKVKYGNTRKYGNVNLFA